MSDINRVKLLQLTASRKNRPEGMESPEFDFCCDIMSKIDMYIYEGLLNHIQPTTEDFDRLIHEAYQQNTSGVAFALNLHSESEFTTFCYNKYCYNKNQLIKVHGKLFTLKHVNFWG